MNAWYSQFLNYISTQLLLTTFAGRDLRCQQILYKKGIPAKITAELLQYKFKGLVISDVPSSFTQLRHGAVIPLSNPQLHPFTPHRSVGHLKPKPNSGVLLLHKYIHIYAIFSYKCGVASAKTETKSIHQHTTYI